MQETEILTVPVLCSENTIEKLEESKKKLEKSIEEQNKKQG